MVVLGLVVEKVEIMGYGVLFARVRERLSVASH